MNPLTNMKNVKKLSEQELYARHKTSWHDQYRDSAWIFIGGLPYDLTEGDIICIFSQYGEIVNINLIRDKDTGKSKGFCFICYEDQRSTDLAVDNFNGINILKRTIRVDHVANYKVPKDGKKVDETTKMLHEEGCAPKPVALNMNRVKLEEDEYVRETLADQLDTELRLPPRLPIDIIKQEPTDEEVIEKKVKKEKKKKHKKKSKKRNRKSSSSSDKSDSDDDNMRLDSLDAKSRDQESKPSRPNKKYENEKTRIDKKGSDRSELFREEKGEGSRSGSRDKKRYRSRSRSMEREKSSRSRSVSPKRSKNKHHRFKHSEQHTKSKK